jgi:hypothetical protein
MDGADETWKDQVIIFVRLQLPCAPIPLPNSPLVFCMNHTTNMPCDVCVDPVAAFSLQRRLLLRRLLHPRLKQHMMKTMSATIWSILHTIWPLTLYHLLSRPTHLVQWPLSPSAVLATHSCTSSHACATTTAAAAAAAAAAASSKLATSLTP